MSFYKGIPSIDFTKIFDDVRKTLDLNRQRKREDRRTEMVEQEFKERSSERSERRFDRETARRRDEELFEAGADKRSLDQELATTMLHWNRGNKELARKVSPGIVAGLERKEILAKMDKENTELRKQSLNLAIKAKTNEIARQKLNSQMVARSSNLNTRKADILDALVSSDVYDPQLALAWKNSNDFVGFERDLSAKIQGIGRPPEALLDLIEIYQIELKALEGVKSDAQGIMSGIPGVERVSIPTPSKPVSEVQAEQSRRSIAYLDQMMADKTELGLGFRETVKGLSSPFGVKPQVILDRVRKYERGGPLPFGKNIRKNASFLYLVKVLRDFAQDEPEIPDVPEPTSLGLFPSVPPPDETLFP